MGVKFKIIITALMVIGFAAGFCNALYPQITAYDIERIHIFFFNLCCGGTIILHYTQATNKTCYKTGAFFLLSVVFSVTAFLNLYIISIIILLILAFITETVRIKKFSFFPFQFFQSNVPTAKKIHQASLLCLSIGLILSVLAIINQQYYQIINSNKA
ncbi:MAG: hypothetical protein JRJ49_09475 [Deltaproteobacteria bacterium]|nr:hypothetical protein [Deltaproteobacteria bacterium]